MGDQMDLARQQQVLDAERARLEADRKRLEEAERVFRDQRTALEATTIAALHAQAVSVLNIRTLIPVVLDYDSPNYTKWRGLFLLVVGKYALSDHVLSDIVYPDDPAWNRMECTVLSWLYGTISSSLVEIVMSPSASARHVWLGLEEQFIGNKETRALYLDAEFRNFAQGDLSISDYCRKLKSMADALGDLGEPVLDRTLVLAVLRGLSDKYSHMAALIRRSKPLPSFVDVRAELMLEELTMQNRPGSSTALLATGSGGGASRPGGSSSRPGGSGGSGGGRYNHKNRNNYRGGRTTGGSHNSSSANQTTPHTGAQTSSAGSAQRAGLPSFWNPWSGTVQVWPHVGPASVLGPRPNLAPHGARSTPQPPVQFASPAPGGFYAAAAPGGLHHLSAPGGGLPGTSLQQAGGSIPAPWMPTVPTGHWDQAALLNSFNTMSLTPPSSGEWYMDSGATSHMASDAGSSHSERDSQVQ